jgi:hypothetical protein
MRRRALLVILTGGAASLCSGHAWASERVLRSSGRSEEIGPKSTPQSRREARLRDLKLAGTEQQVRSIVHSPGSYCVTTADDAVRYFLESDLQFKIDSSDLGPSRDKPVILPAGTMGDRARVFFASPHDIAAHVQTNPT